MLHIGNPSLQYNAKIQLRDRFTSLKRICLAGSTDR